MENQINTAPSSSADVEQQMPGNPVVIYGITVASSIYLIASLYMLNDSDNINNVIAVFVGLISVLFSLIGICLLRRGLKTATGVQFVSVFLLVLWIIGAGFGTFRGPFKAAGNGYFTAWMNFALSVYLSYSTVPTFARMCDALGNQAQKKNKGELIVFVVFAASLVVLIEAATVCDVLDDCSGEKGWAVAVGTISVFLTMLLLIPQLDDVVDKYKFEFSLFLSILWLPGAGVATFVGPFADTGNGFFACWAAVVSVLSWAYIELSNKFPDHFHAFESAVTLPK